MADRAAARVPFLSTPLLAPNSSMDAGLSPSITVSICETTTPSKFDALSQPCDRDRLRTEHGRVDRTAHVTLERDFRRLNIDSHQRPTSTTKTQPKKLDRAESISLPTTPIEHKSSTFSHRHYPLLLLEQADNDDEEERDVVFTSLKDYTIAVPDHDIRQLMADESTSNSKSTLQSTSSCSSTSSSDSNIPIAYGVDWTEQAMSTSHCWFPYTPNDPSSSQTCCFFSCQNPRPALILSLLQCESCLIVVHTHHLIDLQQTATATKPRILSHSMPACRPSFVDAVTPADHDEHRRTDRHFWSHVAMLTKPCAVCKRKSMSSSLFGNTRASTMPVSDMMNSTINEPSARSSSRKVSASYGCLQCLWCSRGYHRRCWEQIADDEDKTKCDYGVFRNIIVRPQWISRVPGSSTAFRAQYSADNDLKDTYTPVLLFINKRSGGQSGEKIYRKLLRLLNPRQVFLLENDRTIIHALDIYSSLSNVRICVFGGDGTVGWILGRLAESYLSLNNPPVCVCPLGTGNDLSRVLSWGEQYDPKRLLSTLTQIPQAQAIALDRWQVTIEQLDPTASSSTPTGGRPSPPVLNHPKFIRDTKRASFQNHRSLPNTRFINYMSFGLDAAIALEFHDRRSRDPAKFSSPLKNKLMYLNESRKYLNDFARSRMWNLGSYIRLICDGENLTHLIQNCHTLLVLNIPGYASGTNPWGKTSMASLLQTAASIQKDSDSFEQISTSSVDLADMPANAHDVYELVTLNECSIDPINASTRTTPGPLTTRFERQDFGDKKIEVVGLSTTHMATIHIGFRGTRIAQCSQLRVDLCCPMTAQMDGEPFYLPESVAVNITHAGQVLVLRNENR